MKARSICRAALPALVATVLVMVVPVVATGQGMGLYQFQPGQLMRFDVQYVQGDDDQSGYYQVEVQQAGSGQVQLSIDAKVGDNACNTSSTVAAGAGLAGQLMMTCLPLIPVASALFAPTWTMFMGQSMQVGNSWSMGNVSFAVTENCTYAGVQGVRTVMTEDGEEKINTCYSQSYPLPLYVMFTMDDGYVELEATKVQGG